MILQIRSTDSAETERLGENLGKLLEGGEVIELIADLGGGKTTFVKGLVRGIGSKDRVASPTFTLNKVYSSEKLKIHHFDFYRLLEPGLTAEQLKESVSSKDVVTVIEWADTVKSILPEKCFSIRLSPTSSSEDERDIRIEYPESEAKIIDKLREEYTGSRP